jgi:hypothetical protein
VIEFRCEGCQKLLRTSDDKAGATAKCPQCGMAVLVPAPSFAPPAAREPVRRGFEAPGPERSEDERDEDEHEEGGREGPPPSLGDSGAEDFRACPMCGEKIRVNATRCRYCGEATGSRRLVGAGGEARGQLDIGSIFSRSWKIFSQEMGMCLAIVWLPQIVMLALFFGAYFGFAFLFLTAFLGPGGRGGPPNVGAIAGLFVGGLVAFVGIMLLQLWLTAGKHVALLKIVRGERADIADLFKGGRFMLRLFGNGLLVSLVLFGEYMLFAFLMVVVMLAVGNPGGFGGPPPLLIIFPLYGAFLAFVMATFAAIWPWQYALVDRDLPGTGCLTEALAMTKGQRMMSFVLLLLEGLVGAAGTFALCIGSIFTVPFAQLMSAVAYCDLAGERTIGD